MGQALIIDIGTVMKKKKGIDDFDIEKLQRENNVNDEVLLRSDIFKKIWENTFKEDYIVQKNVFFRIFTKDYPDLLAVSLEDFANKVWDMMNNNSWYKGDRSKCTIYAFGKHFNSFSSHCMNDMVKKRQDANVSLYCVCGFLFKGLRKNLEQNSSLHKYTCKNCAREFSFLTILERIKNGVANMKEEDSLSSIKPKSPIEWLNYYRKIQKEVGVGNNTFIDMKIQELEMKAEGEGVIDN